MQRNASSQNQVRNQIYLSNYDYLMFYKIINILIWFPHLNSISQGNISETGLLAQQIKVKKNNRIVKEKC